MKKTYLIKSFAVALAATAIVQTTSAQSTTNIPDILDAAGSGRSSLRANASSYKVYTLVDGSVSPTTTQTVTGTASRLNISGALYAQPVTATTVTSSITGTARAVYNSQTLLMLILGAEKRSETKGYSLVYFTAGNATSFLSYGAIGALKGTEITINTPAVSGWAYLDAFLTRNTAKNGVTSQTGIGSLGWDFTIPAGKQSVFASVTPKGNMPKYKVEGNGGGRFTERTSINAAGSIGVPKSATYNSWVETNYGYVDTTP